MESVINYARDILRKEGITGMDSITHCIAFFICRMMTKQLCKKTDIDLSCSFEKIMYDDEGDEKEDGPIYNKFYKEGDILCFIGQLVKKLNFRNIRGNFKLKSAQHLRLILKKIEELKIEDLSKMHDIIGTIYELHLRSGASNSMRELGQYYTHRKVIEYMIKLCDPSDHDIIVDPTMGTGGFLTMTVKYLNEKYKNKLNWKEQKNNLYGFDIDENNKNLGLLNVLLETGELCDDTIFMQDTLHRDMLGNDMKKPLNANIILANEPMGLKGIKYDEVCDRIKKINIKGTKAEPLFLQLFMQSLKKDGRCAVIVPDGVLFNDSIFHKNTRKHLIENFNVKKVVGLNDDFFLNTGVKTSILFFVNDGKTKEVEFSELKLKDGNVKETSIIYVKYKEIVKNKYSLFVNKYNIKEIEKFDGIEY